VEDKPFELRLRVNRVRLLLLATGGEEWLRAQVESIGLQHRQTSLESTSQASVGEIAINSGAFKLLNRSSNKELFSC